MLQYYWIPAIFISIYFDVKVKPLQKGGTTIVV